MKKMQVNSPEYRALVSGLLGKEVKFEDVPQIEVRKSPPIVRDVASPPMARKDKSPSSKNKKSNKYVVIRTGYTARLINKFRVQEKLLKKGKGKNNDIYIISDPKKKEKLFGKIVFIYDKLWGKGVYSAGLLQETSELLDILKRQNLDRDGIVVFRVSDLEEGDDLVYKLKDMDYNRMFIRDEEYWRIHDKHADSDDEDEEDESEDRDQPYEKDETYKIGNKTFRYILVDSESG